MENPYKVSREMGRSAIINKDPSEISDEEIEAIFNPLNSPTHEDGIVVPEETEIKFESNFFWKDSFEGQTNEFIVVNSDIDALMKSAETLYKKEVVGIFPMDEKSVKLIFGSDL